MHIAPRKIIVAVTLAVAAGTSTAAVTTRQPALTCPKGYQSHDVRIQDSRLESDPRTGNVVVPNTWPEDNAGHVDRRYLVAALCVRPLTNAERQSEPYTDGGPPIGSITPAR